MEIKKPKREKIKYKKKVTAKRIKNHSSAPVRFTFEARFDKTKQDVIDSNFMEKSLPS